LYSISGFARLYIALPGSLDSFPSPMSRFGICWTLNNYTPENVITIKGLVGKCGIKGIGYGMEVGEKGTPHLQGYLQANHDSYKRFKKAFGHDLHLEKQRGTSAEAIDYCKKEGDYWEAGEWIEIASVKDRQGQRTDLKGVMEAVDNGASELDIFKEHAQTMAQFPKFIERYRQLVRENAAMTQLRAVSASWSLWKWQSALLVVLEKEVDPRKIVWLWSREGGMGKSGMAEWLLVTKDACILEPSKKADMAHVFSSDPKGIVVFDCTRATEKGSIGPAYALAEAMKNGILFSGKYNSRTVVFKKPHVIFFANFEPDRTVWSEDRYQVHELKQADI